MKQLVNKFYDIDSKSSYIAYRIGLSIYLPVVVLATVDPAGTREARMNERGVTDAADQTVLVPGPVGYAHHVAVGDTQSASLAHFDPAQFEFDCRRNAGRR